MKEFQFTKEELYAFTKFALTCYPKEGISQIIDKWKENNKSEN